MAPSGFRVIIFLFISDFEILKIPTHFLHHIAYIHLWTSEQNICLQIISNCMCVFVWVVGGHSYACLWHGKKSGGNNGRCKLSCINNLRTYECL